MTPTGRCALFVPLSGPFPSVHTERLSALGVILAIGGLADDELNRRGHAQIAPIGIREGLRRLPNGPIEDFPPGADAGLGRHVHVARDLRQTLDGLNRVLPSKGFEGSRRMVHGPHRATVRIAGDAFLETMLTFLLHVCCFQVECERPSASNARAGTPNQAVITVAVLASYLTPKFLRPRRGRCTLTKRAAACPTGGSERAGTLSCGDLRVSNVAA